MDPIETQQTQRLPLVALRKPTLAQLRQYCQMSQADVAREAGVRLCRVAWMERGITSRRGDVLSVLHVLSRIVGQSYRIEDIQGIRLREEEEQWL